MVDFDWSKVVKYGDSVMLRLPKRMYKETSFPFEIGDRVLISVKGKKLEVSKPDADGKDS